MTAHDVMSVSEVSDRSLSTQSSSGSFGSRQVLEPVAVQAARIKNAVMINQARTLMSSATTKALPSSGERRGEVAGAEKKFKNVNLWALVREMRAYVCVRNRRYHLKVYPKCFVGFEAAQWMIDSGYAANEEDAEVLGTMLVTAGLIFHVCDDHEFKAKYLFYRFAVDERALDEEVSVCRSSRLSKK
mmetsp:Transcript_17494/g.37992  ORF Transcript_17494/g.37992 Transcript_17494/m.37992 type:complete len:187 (+) Transcript_17494:26-586(+)